jgi:hypothetical protein
MAVLLRGAPVSLILRAAVERGKTADRERKPSILGKSISLSYNACALSRPTRF